MVRPCVSRKLLTRARRAGGTIGAAASEGEDEEEVIFVCEGGDGGARAGGDASESCRSMTSSSAVLCGAREFRNGEWLMRS